MSFHKEDHTIAMSGGAGSFVTDHPWRGLLWNVIIEPESSDTTYLVVVTDDKGDEVIRFDQTTPADPNSTNEALEMPVIGTYTFTASAGSVDEDLRVRTQVREVAYS